MIQLQYIEFQRKYNDISGSKDNWGIWSTRPSCTESSELVQSALWNLSTCKHRI